MRLDSDARRGRDKMAEEKCRTSQWRKHKKQQIMFLLFKSFTWSWAECLHACTHLSANIEANNGRYRPHLSLQWGFTVQSNLSIFLILRQVSKSQTWKQKQNNLLYKLYIYCASVLLFLYWCYICSSVFSRPLSPLCPFFYPDLSVLDLQLFHDLALPHSEH